jgi:putative ABC transport system permease protein
MAALQVFYLLFLRPLRQNTLRTILTILSVSLGVAVVLAIELAGDAAAGSFQASVETLAGKADFELTSTSGVPAEVLSRLAAMPFDLKLQARIEGNAMVEPSLRVVPLVGVDMVATALERSTREQIQAPGTSPSGTSEYSVGGEGAWIGIELARDLHLKRGDRLRILVNDRRADYPIQGLLGEGSSDVIVMDLAPMSQLLGRGDSLDRILIGVPKNEPRLGWERALRQALPPGVTIAPAGSGTNENRKMLEAFRWNLRVLSYIALIVGAFLIYNTISVSVVRRRTEIGVLRALGATRGGVLLAFLAEALCLGLAGSIGGVLLGRLLALGAVGMVASTVNSLYVSSRPGVIALTPSTTLLALALGVGVSIVSSFAPAWEASRVAPVEAMARGRVDHQARLHTRRGLVWAVLLAVAAYGAALQAPVSGKPLFGYLAAVLTIGVSAMAIPALVSGLAALSGRYLEHLLGVEALLASRSLAGSLRRTSVLAGALSTAVAMMVAVAIMVGSFRQTVVVWMEERLQADLYIRSAGASAGDRFPALSADTLDRLRPLAEVGAVDAYRAYSIHYNGIPATLGASDVRLSAQYMRRPYLGGENPAAVARELHSGANVIVSEPFANKHNTHKGDWLHLELDGRKAHFRVVAIYADYSSERGSIVMDRATLLHYLPDAAPTSVAVYIKPGVTPEQGKHAVEQALAGRMIRVFTNRKLRDEAIKIFDRTFAITYALEAVAVFVAGMGVAGALIALVIDRRREFGLLRFLGAASGQVRRLILFEAGLLGLLGNAAGFALGYLLSLLLIFVINRQSFGWTIQFHWPVGVLLGALTAVYAATLMASIQPARIAVGLNPIEVVHEE